VHGVDRLETDMSENDTGRLQCRAKKSPGLVAVRQWR